MKKKKRRIGAHPRVESNAQAFYNRLWQVEPRARHSVAPNPVSLEKSHLAGLGQTHLVGEKNDGVRCLILLGRTEDGSDAPFAMRVFRNREMAEIICTLVEEEHAIFIGPQSVTANLLDGTLIDGEYVEATDEYVAFDAVAVGGYDLKPYPLEMRLRAMRAAVEALPSLPFKVRCKNFLPVSEALHIFESAENCDGLVFMPRSDPMRSGRHSRMYKWKVLEHCTLDLAWDGTQWYAVGDRGAKMTDIPFQTPTEGRYIANAIYELAPSVGSPWKVVRQRRDKVAPNHIVTIRKTLRSIRDNITMDHIMDSAGSIVRDVE